MTAARDGQVASHAEQAVRDLPVLPAELGAAEPVDEVETLLGMVVRRYPDPRLTGAALDEVRADLAGQFSRSKTLSAVPLENGEGPGYVFQVYRADGK